MAISTLEGIRDFLQGLGSFGSAIGQIKNKKHAFDELIKRGFSEENSRYYVETLSPQQLLNLMLKVDLEQQKAGAAKQELQENKQALSYLNLPGIEEADPAFVKAVVKARSKGKGIYGAAQNVGAQLGITEPYSEWNTEYNEQGNPTGVTIDGTFFKNEKLGPTFVESNLKTKSGQPYSMQAAQQGQPMVQETVTERPIMGKQGRQVGEQVTVTDRERMPQTPQEQQANTTGMISNVLQKGLEYGVPFAKGAIGMAAGFPADIASLGARGINYLSPGAQLTPEQEAASQANLRKLAEQNPQNRAHYEALAAYKPGSEIEALTGILPTSENIKKGLGYGAEQIGLGKYNKETPQAKFAEQTGEIFGALTNPKQIVEQGAKYVGSQILKALSVQALGEGVKEYTDNEALGALAKTGALVGAAVFPGTFKSISNKLYNQFDKVVKEGEAAGKKVDLNPFLKTYNNIKNKISKLSPHSKERQALENEVARLDELLLGNRDKTVDPEALSKSYKGLSERLRGKSIPTQAKDYGYDLVNVQRDALKAYGDSIAPGSGKLLSQADEVYKAGSNIYKQLGQVKYLLNPRNFGWAFPLLTVGGYKALGTLGTTAMAGNYLRAMMGSPTIRNTMKELFKATGAKNTVLAGKLIDRLNSEAEKAVKKLPADQQREFQNVLQEERKKFEHTIR